MTTADGTPFMVTWNPYAYSTPPGVAEAKAALRRPIGVLFTPKQSGEFHAVVTFSSMWSDGYIEHVTTQLIGRARKLDEVPASTKETAREATSASDDVLRKGDQLRETDSQDPTPYPQNALTAFDDATTLAANAAFDVGQSQLAGAGTVKDEAKNYKAPPQPKELWKDLLEIAITMGTAGVAGVISKALVGEMSKALESAGASASASRVTKTLAKSVEKEDSLVVEGTEAS
ncbi:MAG TPA: hypothetical protein VHV78_11960, partial [Gemmatimonadaceae bacterium]|nr:hypothetical protein [Gemmatimonadaceae bacterium]